MRTDTWLELKIVLKWTSNWDLEAMQSSVEKPHTHVEKKKLFCSTSCSYQRHPLFVSQSLLHPKAQKKSCNFTYKEKMICVLTKEHSISSSVRFDLAHAPRYSLAHCEQRLSQRGSFAFLGDATFLFQCNPNCEWDGNLVTLKLGCTLSALHCSLL